MDWLYDFLSTQGFQPHGFCFLWHPGIFWTHILADLLTGLSYLSIPAALIYLALKRSDIVPTSMLFLFGAFVVFCGMTHLFGIWTMWVPAYGLEAIVKSLTAAVSVMAAIVLWLSMPRTLALPTVALLTDRTNELQLEVTRRELLEREMVLYRDHLESEVKRRTAEVDRANTRLKHFAEASADFFWETSADLSINWVSEGPEQYWDAENFLLKSKLWDIVQQKGVTDGSSSQQELRRALSDHEAFRDFEFNFKSSSTGSRTWWRISGLSFSNGDGDFLGYRGTITDVTDQRMTSAQLRQAQSRELVGRLAGGVAHDFNNILTVLRGNLGMIQEMPKLEVKHREMLRRCVRAVERANRLTLQLLTLGQRQTLQPEPILINELLIDLRELVRMSVPSSISLEIHAECDVPPIFADPSALQDALLNLVVNAKDAMINGGTLTLDAKTIPAGEMYKSAESRHSAEDSRVRLTVSDTGIGIAEDELDHIFEPFYSRKLETEGAGLGLSMVRGFVEQSGGEVSVRSKEDEGTQFLLDFPAFQAADERLMPTGQPVLPAVGTARRISGTVLVVDDDLDVLETLEGLINSFGCSVLTCDSGDEALILIEDLKELPNVVLSDIQMPGKLQGQGLVRILGEKHPELPVVLMTGHAPERVQIEVEALGVPMLLKPVNELVLFDRLRQIMQESSSSIGVG